MIPVLLITFDRLEYTKKAFEALLKSEPSRVIIIDNGSRGETVEWLINYAEKQDRVDVVFNDYNKGIAGAMSQFIEATPTNKYVGKVDNDTIVPPDIWRKLVDKCEWCDIDIIQARHLIDPAVWPATGTWEGFVSGMTKHPKDETVHYHHFVGGSGIVFRRDKVMDVISDHAWPLYGWRAYQRKRPDLRKAFTDAVTVDLLDGGGRYDDYPEYYKQTKRLK